MPAIAITPNEYRSLLRTDLNGFIERSFYELNPTTDYKRNWHLEMAAAALEGCRRGEIKRLIINQPPRSLKSHCASVAFPAFLLGHQPTSQIICASYGQDLANKHALDCRNIMNSSWYQELFPGTRLSAQRQAVQEFLTTRQGMRYSTSVGGALTGRGADFIIIDDPLKPDEALSETQRKTVNEWYDHTVLSRLNDKSNGCIILIMQRLHEDDLVGYVTSKEPWTVVQFPAIAEVDETHQIHTFYGVKYFRRRAGEALHPDRESLETLNRIRETLGSYNFSGQYQQAPAPLGGGMIKTEWFKIYTDSGRPSRFDMIIQSWDTANKPTELADYSVCTTWGVKDKHLYLLHVLRKRLGYPELKRIVREHALDFCATVILIEDKASGTQLIQELIDEGMHEIQQYKPKMDKTMRMHAVTATMENGFVHIPERAAWLGDFLHELASFPNVKFDDQADSTSQALGWFKEDSMNSTLGYVDFLKKMEAQEKAAGGPPSNSPMINRGALLREWDRGNMLYARRW